MGTSAGVPVSSDGSPMARLLDGLRRHLVTSAISGVTGSPMAMSSMATMTVTFVARPVAGAAALVQQDDDSNEGQDGEQHPNQDDQTIGSLHGDSLTKRMKIGAQMSREDMQAL